MEKTDRTNATETAGRIGENVLLRLRVPPPLLHQLEDLRDEPAFAFDSMEHVILSALWSFASYKMKQIRALRDNRGVGPR
jgi:hypothetical protein